jgi:hypothetical protein
MTALFPYASKGLIFVGSLSLLTGTLSSIFALASAQDTPDLPDYGVLTETLAPSVRKINIACSFFPKTSKILDRLHRHVLQFVTVYHEMLATTSSQHSFSRRFVRVQRKIFNDIDDLILEQSETIAIQELFDATDDLKQQITNVCLNLDH